MKSQQFKTKFNGEDLIIEFGSMATLADGAVTVRYKDTVILATACISDEPKEGMEFFPFLVDYEERFYAAGKISGSRFIRREGRPSDKAILTCRMIDRPLRPLFPKNYFYDVQIVITTLAYDGENEPGVLGIIGASCALMMTNAPFEGPVGAARIGYKNNDFIINPSKSELEDSQLDLVIASTEENVMMLEAQVNELSEDKVLEAIKLAQKSIKPILEIQKEIAKAYKKTSQELKEQKDVLQTEKDIYADVKKYLGDQLKGIIKEQDKDKRSAMTNEFEKKVLENFEGNYKQIDLKNAFDQILKKEVRDAILNDNHRPDGRKMDEIRQIDLQVGVLPRTHGSALFNRGQTQALSIVTLGGPGEEQLVETMTEESEKRYMHHYNFPPFSTGEIKPMRGASRREIGHGYLAEKALLPVLPNKKDFPYTIRVVSEILASNGSSSMAATCGSTLALMDAGVPIKKPVAGIAMGLVTNEDNKKYTILTDIQGLEDFGGDMDFKVAGTFDGITAIQMDTKIHGLSLQIITETLEAAKKARLVILEKIKNVIPEPRKEMSQYAPRILTVNIEPEKIGELIGPGGKTINAIIDECGGKDEITIDIEEDGVVSVCSTNSEMAKKAIETIKSITKEIEVGQKFVGEIKAIQKNRNTGVEIGAIVQLTPKVDGMVHISQFSDKRIEKVSDVVKVGDKIPVIVIDVDKERGRIALSAKAAKGTK